MLRFQYDWKAFRDSADIRQFAMNHSDRVHSTCGRRMNNFTPHMLELNIPLGQNLCWENVDKISNWELSQSAPVCKHSNWPPMCVMFGKTLGFSFNRQKWNGQSVVKSWSRSQIKSVTWWIINGCCMSKESATTSRPVISPPPLLQRRVTTSRPAPGGKQVTWRGKRETGHPWVGFICCMCGWISRKYVQVTFYSKIENFFVIILNNV